MPPAPEASSAAYTPCLRGDRCACDHNLDGGPSSSKAVGGKNPLKLGGDLCTRRPICGSLSVLANSSPSRVALEAITDIEVETEDLWVTAVESDAVVWGVRAIEG
ncbi:hypothetical protein MRX96_030802 [Rhipicephalus microplus]